MTSNGGRSMRAFMDDPAKYIRYILAEEFDVCKRQRVQQIIANLFDAGKPLDQQLETIEHVDNILFGSYSAFHLKNEGELCNCNNRFDVLPVHNGQIMCGSVGALDFMLDFNLCLFHDKMLADLICLYGVDKSAELFRQFNDRPTYYYHYSHRGGFTNGDVRSELIDTDAELGEEKY